VPLGNEKRRYLGDYRGVVAVFVAVRVAIPVRIAIAVVTA
jgi:hypothetical protein